MNTGKQLILVKHSLPEIEESVPACEWNLSVEGRIRAKRLAEKLKPRQPEIIVSSGEPKAKQTAAILAQNLGLKFTVANGLHEHDRSNIHYYSKDEFHLLVRELFENPNKLVFGNETASCALIRYREAVESILSLYGNKRSIIVSHGTVISLFVSWLTGIDGYLLWSELGLPSFVLLDLQFRKVLKVENLV